MSDQPILFSAPMVRAILREIEQPGAGKTQTRRVLSNEKPMSLFNGQWTDSYVLDPGNQSWRDRELRYAGGDRLYVREAWRSEAAYDDLSPANMGGEEPIRYEADGSHQSWGYPAISKLGRFRQGMHMPRWASRITLTVADVRVQRLQEISREDAMAEGVVQTWGDFMGDPPDWAVASINRHGDASGSHIYDNRTSVENFRELWNHINAERGYGWEANPWVAAYTFRPTIGNIDQVPG